MSTDEDDYEVGYGKPPRDTRFKKGQSGNPNGRPKGAQGLRACLKKELESTITVREDNRERCITKARAIAKRIAANALKGDSKALAALLKRDAELYGSVGAEAEETPTGKMPQPID